MLALVHMHCLSHSSPGRGAPASRAAKLRVATDLTQRDILLCALRDAREVKHVFPALALCVIRPFLGQMIVVFLDHREPRVVKIAGRFQPGDADEQKYQRFLRIGDGRRRHLWLILRRAVVGGNQMISIHGEHRNHISPRLGPAVFHQGTAVSSHRVKELGFAAEGFPFPFALERRQTIKRLLTLRFVRC
jgi:hypothetical protein